MASPFESWYRNVAYLAGLGAGTLTCWKLGQLEYSPLLSSFLGDVAATTTIFSFSFLANNSCVYDAYWPVAPIPIAAYWLAQNRSPSVAAWTGFGLLAAWALRYLSIEVKDSLTFHSDSRILLQRSITKIGDMRIFVPRPGRGSGL
jgi:hypothetical protein